MTVRTWDADPVGMKAWGLLGGAEGADRSKRESLASMRSYQWFTAL
jgi:hypothetical protein